MRDPEVCAKLIKTLYASVACLKTLSPVRSMLKRYTVDEHPHLSHARKSQAAIICRRYFEICQIEFIIFKFQEMYEFIILRSWNNERIHYSEILFWSPYSFLVFITAPPPLLYLFARAMICELFFAFPAKEFHCKHWYFEDFFRLFRTIYFSIRNIFEVIFLHVPL